MICGIITGRQVLSFFNTGKLKGICSPHFTVSGWQPGGKHWPMKTRIKIWTDDKLEGTVAKIWSCSCTTAQKQRKAANQVIKQEFASLNVHRCSPTILLDIQVHGRYYFNLLLQHRFPTHLVKWHLFECFNSPLCLECPDISLVGLEDAKNPPAEFQGKLVELPGHQQWHKDNETWKGWTSLEQNGTSKCRKIWEKLGLLETKIPFLGVFKKSQIGSKSTIFEGQKSKPLPPELLDLALYGSHQLSNHLKRGRCACKKGMKPVRKWWQSWIVCGKNRFHSLFHGLLRLTFLAQLLFFGGQG